MELKSFWNRSKTDWCCRSILMRLPLLGYARSWKNIAIWSLSWLTLLCAVSVSENKSKLSSHSTGETFRFIGLRKIVRTDCSAGAVRLVLFLDLNPKFPHNRTPT